jgi:hypothetical protein
MKMEQIVCSETSAYKIYTPGELPRRKHTTNIILFAFLCSSTILNYEHMYITSEYK